MVDGVIIEIGVPAVLTVAFYQSLLSLDQSLKGFYDQHGHCNLITITSQEAKAVANFMVEVLWYQNDVFYPISCKSLYLYYISQWQLITPSNGQKHYQTAVKRPIFRNTCRLQMVSESRDF